ncbi:hypothetical protein GCM10017673_54420 [Streptosporangium violaceochromogenes]|nr:hypothetical protein GCM10017673_54420 [Streptosporangium violaceochromogenes]
MGDGPTASRKEMIHMDPIERAGTLKSRLVRFALSRRFERELSAVFEREFPGGVVHDEGVVSLVIDHFALQHRLADGDTVVDRFVAARPKLSAEDRDMLLGWKDVVEGVFEVKQRNGDTLTLFNLIDELTYSTRSNVGAKAFRSIRKGMFLVGRCVPLGSGWMLSGNPAAFPARSRDVVLGQAAELVTRNPQAAFRNPDKLSAARRMLAEQREIFIGLYQEDFIVVPASELDEHLNAFWSAVAAKARPGDRSSQRALLGFSAETEDADTVAIHFDPDTGLGFFLDFGLLEDLFADPALIARRRYRETLTDYLRDDDVSPIPIRRLAERDPDRASTVFRKLLKKRDFVWETHGEALLREHKARYFDTPRLPGSVPVSEEMAAYLRSLNP